MGRSTRGIHPDEGGSWQVDKIWRGTRFRQRGFTSAGEAQAWLIKQLEDKLMNTTLLPMTEQNKIHAEIRKYKEEMELLERRTRK